MSNTEDKTLNISGNRDAEDRTLLYTSASLDKEDIKKWEKDVSSEWKKGDIIVDLYEVLEILGEGAFGTVYRVLHRNWNKELAVKSLRPELSANEDNKNAFVKECQGWVNLGLHPNIVSCYYVRNLGNLPRIFLEYVEGGTLADLIKKGNLKEQNKILDLSLQFLEGLSFAHKKGLIHRDIKPHNCLVTTQGELKITDFGIALGLEKLGISQEKDKEEEKTFVLEEGGAAGTPAYMPPEQWDSRYGNTGPWTDIYAFGIMLYEMCCGKRPFDSGGEHPLALKAKHLTAEPKSPASVKENISPLLSNFILKCLKKKPEERYKSCEEAGEELKRIYEEITGESPSGIKAKEVRLLADSLNNRAVSMLDLGEKEEANKLWEEALKTDGTHIEASYNYSLFLWRTGKISDEEAVKRMEEVTQKHKSNSSAAYFLSLIHMERGDFESSIIWLDEICNKEPGNKEAHIAIDRAKKLCERQIKKVRTLSGHREAVTAAAITEDETKALSSSYDKTLRLWDLSSGKCLEVLEEERKGQRAADSIIMTSDGKWAAVNEDKLNIWNPEEGKVIDSIGYVNITALAMSGNEKFVLAGAYNKQTYLIQREPLKEMKRFFRHGDRVTSVCSNYDGTVLLSGSADKTIKLWDPSEGKCLKTFEGHIHEIYSLAVTKKGDVFLSGAGEKTIKIWHIESGKCLKTLEGHTSPPKHIAFNNDEGFALSSAYDGTLKIWEISSGRCLRTIQIEKAGHFAISKNGKYLLIGTGIKNLYLWDIELLKSSVPWYRAPFTLSVIKDIKEADEVETRFLGLLKKAEEEEKKGAYKEALKTVLSARELPGYELIKEGLDRYHSIGSHMYRKGLRNVWHLRNFKGHSADIWSLAINKDSTLALSGSPDKHIKLWNLSTGECIRTFEGHRANVSALAFLEEGRFVSGGNSKELKFWNMKTGECTKSFETPRGVNCISLSEDKEKLLVACNNLIMVYNIPEEKWLDIFEGHTGFGINDITFTNDGESALSCGADKRVIFWDLKKGKPVKTIEPGYVYSIAVSKCGDYLLTGSSGPGENLKLWHVPSKKCIKTMEGHTRISSISLTKDEKFALTSGGSWPDTKDFTIKLWDLEEGKCIKTLDNHNSHVNCALFNSEERLILSGSGDKTLNLWELEWDFTEEKKVTGEERYGIIPKEEPEKSSSSTEKPAKKEKKSFFSKIFSFFKKENKTQKNILRKSCSREEFTGLPLEEKKKFIKDFLIFLSDNFKNKEFGYDSFPGIKYDKMVLSTIFQELKNAGYIKGAGYMTFSLTGKSPEDLVITDSPQPSEEKLLLIRGSIFSMGSNNYPGTQPVRNVTVSSFYMGKYAVTGEEYIEFLNDMGNKLEGNMTWIEIKENDEYYAIEGGPLAGEFKVKKGYEKKPVTSVTWHGAIAYCNWLSEKEGLSKCYGEWSLDGKERTGAELENFKPADSGYRLPTEAEWEYACRAGTNSNFYWGDNEEVSGNYMWHHYNSGEKCHNVGEKKPNNFGLYDMNGNIWEWCNDNFSPYDGKVNNNPLGPKGHTNKVTRGGSWMEWPENCSSFARDQKWGRWINVGFRLVKRA